MNTDPWRQVVSLDAPTAGAQSIAVGGETIVAVGFAPGPTFYVEGVVWRSADGGETWSTTRFPYAPLEVVRYGNGQFVAVLGNSYGEEYFANSYHAYVSTDGVSWDLIAGSGVVGHIAHGAYMRSSLRLFPTGWMAQRPSFFNPADGPAAIAPQDGFSLDGTWVGYDIFPDGGYVNGEAVSTTYTESEGSVQIWSTSTPHSGGWTLRYTFPSFPHEYRGPMTYGGGQYAFPTSGALLTASSLEGPWSEISWDTVNPNDATEDAGFPRHFTILHEADLWLIPRPSVVPPGTVGRTTICFAYSLDGPWYQADLEDENPSQPTNYVTEIAYHPPTDTWFATGGNWLNDNRYFGGYYPPTIWSSRSVPLGTGAGWGMIL